MGYDLHITRREHWSDDEQRGVDIALDEWLKYIDNEPDLELSDAYRIKVPGSETESQVAPGYCEWTNHPLGERPWFDYSDGSISTKNPDDDTIKKMLSIAKTFHGKVQGDDGEIYSISPDNKIIYGDISGDENSDINSRHSNKKSWWKFW